MNLRKLRYGAHGVAVHGYAAAAFDELASESGMEVVEKVPLGRAGYFVHFRRRPARSKDAGPATGEVPRRRLVIHVLPSDVARGAQVFARDLRAVLDSGSDEHRILTLFRTPAAVLGADSSLGVPPGIFRSLGFDPRVVSRLRRTLGTLRPDVIVAHGGEPLKYLAFVGRGTTPLVYYAIGTTSEAARHGPRRHFLPGSVLSGRLRGGRVARDSRRSSTGLSGPAEPDRPVAERAGPPGGSGRGRRSRA